MEEPAPCKEIKEKMGTETVELTGLTGGMGAGKSSVARFLCRRFAVACLHADAVVHELLEPGEKCWQVIAGLDHAFVRQDQTIDKPRLRQALFSDAFLRQRLNEGMHPIVRDAILRKVHEENRATGQKFFLIDVPLLYEAGWQDMFRRVIVVFAGRGQCVARLMRRDNISAAEAETSIAAQWPLLDKTMRADHVIDNSGIWLDTCLQNLHLGDLLWQKK
jgi:dephospho-CoA kinase